MTVSEFGDFLYLYWQVWATLLIFAFAELLFEVAERAWVAADVLALRARVWLLRALLGVGFVDVRDRYMLLVCAPGRGASREYRDRVSAALMAQGALAVAVFDSDEDVLRALNGPQPESDAALTAMGLQRITRAGADGCATTSPR